MTAEKRREKEAAEEKLRRYESHKRWRKANVEHMRGYYRVYRLEHKEECKKRRKRWMEANREWRNAYMRTRRKAEREAR